MSSELDVGDQALDGASQLAEQPGSVDPRQVLLQRERDRLVEARHLLDAL